MSKKVFGLLIGLGLLSLLPVASLAVQGMVSFDGYSEFTPTIDPTQEIDLDEVDITKMTQEITAVGSGILSDAATNLNGTATGAGAGSLQLTAGVEMVSISGHGLDALIGPPDAGGAVTGGLFSGLQGMRTSLDGGHNILGTLNGSGTINFALDDAINLDPGINPTQNVDLTDASVVRMNQTIGTASVTSEIGSITGTATGSGTGAAVFTASTVMNSGQVQGLDALIGPPGGAVTGGLTSGSQQLTTILSGGHELIMVLQ